MLSGPQTNYDPEDSYLIKSPVRTNTVPPDHQARGLQGPLNIPTKLAFPLFNSAKPEDQDYSVEQVDYSQGDHREPSDRPYLAPKDEYSAPRRPARRSYRKSQYANQATTYRRPRRRARKMASYSPFFNNFPNMFTKVANPGGHSFTPDPNAMKPYAAPSVTGNAGSGSGFGFNMAGPQKNLLREAASTTFGSPQGGNLKDFAGQFNQDHNFAKLTPSVTLPNVGPFSNLEFNPMGYNKSVFAPRADYMPNGGFSPATNYQNPYNQDSVEFYGPTLRGNF